MVVSRAQSRLLRCGVRLQEGYSTLRIDSRSNNSLNMVSTNVCILCGTLFSMLFTDSQQKHSFTQSGGLFGECHIFVMHYKWTEPRA